MEHMMQRANWFLFDSRTKEGEERSRGRVGNHRGGRGCP